MTSFVSMIVLVGLIVAGWFAAKGWFGGARVSCWWLSVLWVCFGGWLLRLILFVVGVLWLRVI